MVNLFPSIWVLKQCIPVQRITVIIAKFRLWNNIIKYFNLKFNEIRPACRFDEIICIPFNTDYLKPKTGMKHS